MRRQPRVAPVPLQSIPMPADRHYRVRTGQHALLNSDPRRSGVLAAILGYATLFGATLVILALMYQGLPWLLGLANAEPGTFWFTTVFGILGPVLAFLFVAVVALILILMLRKYLAKIQNRYGPLHNGPSGAFQTVFDALKLVSKEDFAPAGVEKTIFTIAPMLVFVSAFLLMAIIPFAPGWVFANVETGALVVIVAGTLGSFGTLLAGWSMNNKFGLLGGLRAAAQLVSYEVPLSIALLAVVVFSGTMNLSGVVESQFRLWNVFPMFIPFVVYLIAALAEIKMTPFDLPEAESELVAGFNTEYSGMRFGFFFVAEFAELFLLPAILVVFFLGGWHAPVIPAPSGTFLNAWAGGNGAIELVLRANVTGEATTFWQRAFGPGGFFLNLQYAVWFLLKSAIGVYFYMWVRGTLPRFRDDQLMELCWKFLIPLSIVGLLVAVVARLIRIA